MGFAVRRPRRPPRRALRRLRRSRRTTCVRRLRRRRCRHRIRLRPCERVQPANPHRRACAYGRGSPRRPDPQPQKLPPPKPSSLLRIVHNATSKCRPYITARPTFLCAKSAVIQHALFAPDNPNTVWPSLKAVITSPPRRTRDLLCVDTPPPSLCKCRF